jgi:hypothetical protein
MIVKPVAQCLLVVLGTACTLLTTVTAPVRALDLSSPRLPSSKPSYSDLQSHVEELKFRERRRIMEEAAGLPPLLTQEETAEQDRAAQDLCRSLKAMSSKVDC